MNESFLRVRCSVCGEWFDAEDTRLGVCPLCMREQDERTADLRLAGLEYVEACERCGTLDPASGCRCE